MSDPIERRLHEGECGGKVQFPFLDEFIAENVDMRLAREAGIPVKVYEKGGE